MTSYHLNEGSFEVDAPGFVDATTHVFDAKIGDVTALLTVERAAPSGSLDSIARRRGERERERLPAYAELGTREVVYGGAPAIEVCARFRRADGEIVYLRRTHVAAERLVLSFTLTAPPAARESCDAWMDAALESLRFRAD